jgi:polyisoprenoid-binding protein YceI
MLRSRIWLGLAILGFVGCGETKAPTGTAAANTAAPAASASAEDAGKGKKFTLDQGKIEFIGTKPEGKHHGGFAKFEGYALPGAGDKPIESITVDIDTESIWSDDPKLTGHLMNQDFFDVKKHPKATFVSKSIEPAPGGFKVTGDLTLLGNTKTIEFPATITRVEDRIDFGGDIEISRKEFGMTYGEGKVDDLVKITAAFSVPAN